MPTKHRNTATITFSLPPEMAQELREVVREEDRTVSELLREAIRLYMEEREWRIRERMERRQVPAEGTGTGVNKEEILYERYDRPTDPVALYARVSSDRQDVDLSVSAQLASAQGVRRRRTATWSHASTWTRPRAGA